MCLEEITSEIHNKNRPTAKGGRACVSYIKKAVELAMNKHRRRYCDRSDIKRSSENGWMQMAGPYGNAC